MIAQAKSIEHGSAMTNYATKNNRADIVKTNLLTEGLPPMGMWDEMVLHQNRFKHLFARKPVKNTSIRIEASPSEDESKGWTLDDWAHYAERLISEMNRTTAVMYRGKFRKVKPIDMTKAQYFAALHKDSKSGIPHLHLVVNRIDKDGKLIDDFLIGQRAVAAAQSINRQMGWRDPMEIRAENLKEISEACREVLLSMPSFNWLQYKMGLKAKGYDVIFRRSHGEICGYSVKKGHSNYKASEIPSGRKYTASKIENTHRRLHHVAETMTGQPRFPRSYAQNPISADQSNRTDNVRVTHGTAASQAIRMPSFYRNIIAVDGKSYDVNMPLDAYETLSNAIEISDTETQTLADVMKVALLLFMNYVDAATTMSASCGGCGSPGSGWGRDKKDDDKDWARKCARQANWLCKSPRRGYKR